MRVETCTRDELGPALAARVAGDLRAAIDGNRRASIAVPGGTTPAAFLAALATEAIDWRKVTVTLTDERCVPTGDPRSNQGLVSRHLLQGAAGEAVMVPLFGGGQAIDRTAGLLAEKVLPLHVCVLGMGADMHTASLFPGTPGLKQLLDPDSDPLVSQVQPPGADEARITLTARALATAAHTYLLITGAGKREALERAMRNPDALAAPIRAILAHSRDPVVFCAD
ncbi:MAG: 6-phosphogluconolactonase [Minwuia sp.]|nr:6-phosphogluconolactonase [Minwuia sp.]